VHRGLRLVRLPTTVLAQNDAGVGVKNGIDEHGMKNFAGTFAPPFAVVNDFDFLATLPDREWVGGIAEAFKVAIIKDARFFAFLCARACALRARNGRAMRALVRRCAVLHLEHIRRSGDPFEFGSSRPLDFGHWCAHQLEVMSGFTMGHGQAVAVGVALDAVYAAGAGRLTAGERERILDGLERCGLPVWSPLLKRASPSGRPDVLEGIERFREHLGGVFTAALPDSIGRRCEVRSLDEACIAEGIRFLERRAAGGERT
jgi:3-dehydroquinate synthase